MQIATTRSVLFLKSHSIIVPKGWASLARTMSVIMDKKLLAISIH